MHTKILAVISVIIFPLKTFSGAIDQTVAFTLSLLFSVKPPMRWLRKSLLPNYPYVASNFFEPFCLHRFRISLLKFTETLYLFVLFHLFSLDLWFIKISDESNLTRAQIPTHTHGSPTMLLVQQQVNLSALALQSTRVVMRCLSELITSL